jgi:gliding motility-associated lipoprotein GldD
MKSVLTGKNNLINLSVSQFAIVVTIVSLAFTSCNSEYYPETKKKGYFHIEFPEKNYRAFNEPGYPYTFEYPVYANITKDTSFFGEQTENPWWINVEVPRFNGKIYVSYKDIRNKAHLDSLVNDAFKMAYRKHTEVSTGIEDSLLQTPNGVEGIYYSLKGNTATANQFFLTDSTNHFLRGALYFDATPNEDSLGIVNEFLKQDLKHLINSLKWKER